MPVRSSSSHFMRFSSRTLITFPLPAKSTFICGRVRNVKQSSPPNDRTERVARPQPDWPCAMLMDLNLLRVKALRFGGEGSPAVPLFGKYCDNRSFLSCRLKVDLKTVGKKLDPGLHESLTVAPLFFDKCRDTKRCPEWSVSLAHRKLRIV